MSVRREFAQIAYLAVNVNVLGRDERRIGGSFGDLTGAVRRDQKRGFVAQRRSQKPEWRDLGRCIHPNKFAAKRNGSDQVIELRRRGNRSIKLATVADECSFRVDPRGVEHRGEKHALVIGIGVTIRKDFGCSMRLVRPCGERNVHIANCF